MRGEDTAARVAALENRVKELEQTVRRIDVQVNHLDIPEDLDDDPNCGQD